LADSITMPDQTLLKVVRGTLFAFQEALLRLLAFGDLCFQSSVGFRQFRRTDISKVSLDRPYTITTAALSEFVQRRENIQRNFTTSQHATHTCALSPNSGIR